jgi:hypothetical protein
VNELIAHLPKKALTPQFQNKVRMKRCQELFTEVIASLLFLSVSITESETISGKKKPILPILKK